ncbi:hypothetical protein PCL_01879 [Purpureocillium lilacinum]|uniref:Uncharacterized protein n=1 Tax=Purpureocillium lilacinum TaxID=33203 RepID=A0A2U3E2R3_PURLI|nr:hypothetical protein PCL_01879 [Purpureocillium lilacinum]
MQAHTSAADDDASSHAADERSPRHNKRSGPGPDSSARTSLSPPARPTDATCQCRNQARSASSQQLNKKKSVRHLHAKTRRLVIDAALHLAVGRASQRSDLGDHPGAGALERPLAPPPTRGCRTHCLSSACRLRNFRRVRLPPPAGEICGLHRHQVPRRRRHPLDR